MNIYDILFWFSSKRLPVTRFSLILLLIQKLNPTKESIGIFLIKTEEDKNKKKILRVLLISSVFKAY